MNMALLAAGATAFIGSIILLWLAHKYPYQDKD